MTTGTYIKLETELAKNPASWLVTGCAGFIGSHLTERLLELKQKVIGLDNFSTGQRSNLAHIMKQPAAKNNFEFIEGDIQDYHLVERLLSRTNFVLHQAALGSVPRSITDPLKSHGANVDGFCNILVAATKSTTLRKIVFASSSSVYGDDVSPVKFESVTGNILSPYALTKKTNESYAEVFSRTYLLKTVGLRYFNVFGPRQDPNGQYAAVIPRWIRLLLSGEKIEVFGDGTTSRDFCYIENVIQANLLAATANLENAFEVFNVALNQSTSLNKLLETLVSLCRKSETEVHIEYRKFRDGDIYCSRASIEKAQTLIGYTPSIFLQDGLQRTVESFLM